MKPNPKDSRGRSNLFSYRGATVVVDFAHNEGGLVALVAMAKRIAAKRRLLIFGQAGDRGDTLLNGLTEAAAGLDAEHYFIKALPEHSYGKDPQAVVSFLFDGLVQRGISTDRISMHANEMDSVHAALQALKPDDLLLLLTHESYEEVQELMMREVTKD